MGYDLEAIKRRVQELNGQRRNSNIQFWRPSPGEYKIRGLPWRNQGEGLPFVEKWFYYIGNGPGVLSPHHCGKPDPINDLIRKLFSSGKQDDKLLAKKLLPKMRAFMPIIVRGKEDEGVLVWSFGKFVYQKLLGYFHNEEVGDILDPIEGFDINVIITQQPGKQYQDTSCEAARRPTKLSNDQAQAKRWLEMVPNLDDMYKLKTTQEIEAILNSWLSDGVVDKDVGTQKAGAPSREDELDKLVNEVKPSATQKQAKVVEAPDSAKPAKKPPEKKQEPEVVADARKSLDDAFAELMSDEEEA